MFDKDFFQEEPDFGPGQSGSIVGDIGRWGLHLAKIAFLVYSGYHGISATAAYHGASQLAAAAGAVGIVVTEVVLLSLYLAWHNQKITGTAQSLAAGATYLIGFVLACLGIIADSQLHAGFELEGWLAGYLLWVLPIAPAVMALGALLVHELEPGQLNGRKAAGQLLAQPPMEFQAYLAGLQAEMQAAKTVRNMQLAARVSTAKQIADWYRTEEAQQAIADTAKSNAPLLLKAAGIDVSSIPDANGNGQLDLTDIASYLADNPEEAARVFNLARQREEDGELEVDILEEVEEAAAAPRPFPNGRR